MTKLCNAGAFPAWGNRGSAVNIRHEGLNGRIIANIYNCSIQFEIEFCGLALATAEDAAIGPESNQWILLAFHHSANSMQQNKQRLIGEP
jgi:hypothetical protein